MKTADFRRYSGSFSAGFLRYEIKNTSHGDSDFRETVIAELASGEKYVVKLSDNDFTSPDRIKAWKRCSEEYRRLGYYCPEILCSKNGEFPIFSYKGRSCVVYAEEYEKYGTAEDMFGEDKRDLKCTEQAFMMTAKVAAMRFGYADFPSAYCLFDTFCPSDKTDEVTESALEWKKQAEALPDEFRPQVQRIWKRWVDNRVGLEKIYRSLKYINGILKKASAFYTVLFQSVDKRLQIVCAKRRSGEAV